MFELCRAASLHEQLTVPILSGMAFIAGVALLSVPSRALSKPITRLPVA